MERGESIAARAVEGDYDCDGIYDLGQTGYRFLGKV